MAKNDVVKHNEDSIDIPRNNDNVESENYDDNYDGPSENKERIALPSLVPRVVKDDVVMKDNEVISEQQHEST